MNLFTPVEEITGVGPKASEKLCKLGIHTIEDLLLYLPRKWDDYSKIVSIREIKPNEGVSIRVKVVEISSRKSLKGTGVTEAILGDKTGTIKAVWFNQPYLSNTLAPGDELFLAGKVEFGGNGYSFVSPSFEKITPDEDADSLTHTGRIIPIYPETEGISSKFLRQKIKQVMRYIYSLKDYLPESVKDEQNLLDFPAAIRQLHFPEDDLQLKKAKDRLDFDEMFLLQLAVLNSKKSLKQEKAIAVPFDEEVIKKFVQSLDFDLTSAQRKSAWEILQDLSKPEPMNRLLQGDVGSGKTVVAAMALLNVASSGAQAVLLCPTEVLAKQHYQKISKMFEPLGVEVALLTGSTPKPLKEEIITRLHEGELKLVIGTHALLEKNIEFWRLGLAIVDEQHRFGVAQRNALRKESHNTKTTPHFLSMTATPIPRTLTLTLYGDLDVSLLNEMPKNRQKVITKLVPARAKEDAYKFIENELSVGRQAFVVCPLIGEEGESREDSDRKSVMTEYEKLRKKFEKFKVGYLHGRMSPYEKDKMMGEFAAGEMQVLVSTSVIEVGVDVPNATIMIIEDAERFGLSQLHQFRGRVGRGKYQSYCFLFTGSANEDSLKRLHSITATTDGFKLAEIDLDLRGPGDFIGTRQHGIPDIKMKNLVNTVLIKRCRDSAEKFLAKNEIKKFPLLSEKISQYEGIMRLE